MNTKRIGLLAATALVAASPALAQTVTPAIDVSAVEDQQAGILAAVAAVGAVIVAVYGAQLSFRIVPWGLAKVAALFKVRGT
jgi:hypothetical protein